MDKEKAGELTRKLIGSQLDGWTVERYQNHGKSAAVYVARRDGQLAAVKVFDTEIVERYGDHTQLERINRELKLRGHKHEHLVSIYGGGYDKERNLYFVVMELLDGPNLKDALVSVLVSRISDLVRQLASAAKFLEDMDTVHRDIKPENIVLLDDGRRLVLLDLGVIRPISGSNLTDPEGIQAFVGTLQYSSPEFLLREEIQDKNGWRALTFYQIGAVLHDLITKRPIFEKFVEPYAKLVNAVQHVQPTISNPDVDPQLIDLARKCLLKIPSTRTRLLTWDSFDIAEETRSLSPRDRVADRILTLRAQADESKKASQVPEFDTEKMTKNILSTLHSAARTARGSVPGLPPLSQHKCEADVSCTEFVFEPSSESGIPYGLAIRVCVAIIDPAEYVVSCSGCAFIPRGKNRTPLDAHAKAPWFEGVLDNVSLLAAFERFFFGATEWCLTISPGVDKDAEAVFLPSTPGSV